jgi:hypothetical protein
LAELAFITPRRPIIMLAGGLFTDLFAVESHTCAWPRAIQKLFRRSACNGTRLSDVTSGIRPGGGHPGDIAERKGHKAFESALVIVVRSYLPSSTCWARRRADCPIATEVPAPDFGRSPARHGGRQAQCRQRGN